MDGFVTPSFATISSTGVTYTLCLGSEMYCRVPMLFTAGYPWWFTATTCGVLGYESQHIVFGDDRFYIWGEGGERDTYLYLIWVIDFAQMNVVLLVFIERCPF